MQTRTREPHVKTALTIAGSDSGGGAGIQADLKTFSVHGMFGTSAITAITAQNTLGVSGVFPIPESMVVAQIDAVVTDIGADAVKIGMLASAGIAAAVADALVRHGLARIVLDTVMVAKGGARLLDEAAVDVIARVLVPLADVVTANVPEAEALTGQSVRNVTEARRAARALLAMGAKSVVVKGGHLEGPAVDVFADATHVIEIESPRVATTHTHGTGCTMAAAIAARLALGHTPEEAARAAKAYVTRAIQHAPGIGRGHGPLAWGVELLDP